MTILKNSTKNMNFPIFFLNLDSRVNRLGKTKKDCCSNVIALPQKTIRIFNQFYELCP